MKKDLIAVPGVFLANSSYLRDFFKLHEVPVYLETAVDSITEEGVIIRIENTFEYEAYKLKSKRFLLKESELQEKEVSNIEDEENLEENA